MSTLNQEALQAELKKKRICRFCLCQDASKTTNIYMRDTRIKSSAPLPIQIMAIASIEVFSNDGMPSFVCTDCTNMFEYSYQFKQMCKKADNLLRQFPLIGKWPDCLEKPILQTNSSQYYIAAVQDKYSKTTQVRMQNTTKSSAQQESRLLPRKILNSSVTSKPDASRQFALKKEVIPKVETPDVGYNITIFDKIDNNDELSLDDIHQLVAAEEICETQLGNMVVDSGHKDTKPKVLNKLSIRILNKDAVPEIEPRISFPKIKQDVDGKTEIVAKILNANDKYEEEPDPRSAVPIETNIFPCMFCDRTFPLLQLRDIHVKNHTRDRKFQCDQCEKSFFSKYDLHRHSYLHNGKKPFKCTVCVKTFSRSSLLTRHEKSHTDVPKHICVLCERSFLSKKDLEKHAERHNINRPFVCKLCNKGFAFKQGLERHEIVHSRQQPYSCQYCDQSFSTTTKLSRHLTAHAGLRPYPCKFCKKSYLMSHHLTRHLRSHRNVDDPINAISFMCMRCNTSFKSRGELISHSKSHANEENLACPLCKDVFNSIPELTSHIHDHSDGETFACEFCDLIFITSEKLQLHTDHDHTQEMEAYHADDRVQADMQNQDTIKQEDVKDEKLKTTINKDLADELPDTGNELENCIKTIKSEIETPKILKQIILKTAADKPNDDQTDAKTVLIPLKQRKIDVDGKSVKTPEQTKESPEIKRKIPNVVGTPETSDRKSTRMQSLLKLSTAVSIVKTSKAHPEKMPPAKTPPAKTPPSKTSAEKTAPSKTSPTKTPPEKTPPSKTSPSKMTTPKIIKVESEPVAASLSSKSVDNNDDIVTNKLDPKKVKVQKITVTKAQAAAMAKEGRIKIKDGRMILQKSMNM